MSAEKDAIIAAQAEIESARVVTNANCGNIRTALTNLVAALNRGVDQGVYTPDQAKLINPWIQEIGMWVDWDPAVVTLDSIPAECTVIEAQLAIITTNLDIMEP